MLIPQQPQISGNLAASFRRQNDRVNQPTLSSQIRIQHVILVFLLEQLLQFLELHCPFLLQILKLDKYQIFHLKALKFHLMLYLNFFCFYGFLKLGHLFY